MGKQSGFDGVSRYYDSLANLVFGKSMRNAQIFFLNRISSTANILVLGGGTGWWIKDFLASHPDCKIVYIEASEEMIRLARQNTSVNNHVDFRHGTENSIVESDYFDAVITFCYLDLFPEQKLGEVIKSITCSLKPTAQWLVVDFVIARYWHRLMASLMYKFFKVIAELKNQKLPDWSAMLRKCDFSEVEVKFFYGNFIKSAVFKRNS